MPAKGTRRYGGNWTQRHKDSLSHMLWVERSVPLHKQDRLFIRRIGRAVSYLRGRQNRKKTIQPA